MGTLGTPGATKHKSQFGGRGRGLPPSGAQSGPGQNFFSATGGAAIETITPKHGDL